MPPKEDIAVCVFGLLVVFGIACFLAYGWYLHVYKPGLAAGRVLSDLTSALREAGSAWVQTSEVSLQRHWNPLDATGDRGAPFVQGTWQGNLAVIRFQIELGRPETPFRGGAEPGRREYRPPTTAIVLISKQRLAKRAGLKRSTKADLFANKAFVALGMSPQLRPVSEGLFAYGEEDTEIARFFNPSVLALVRSFPRDLFGPSFEGPVIEGSEIRMSWEGHETDPKVIEAAFRLLKTISDAGAAER
jgi:hypothetical protein